jgi:hypothetical protein
MVLQMVLYVIESYLGGQGLVNPFRLLIPIYKCVFKIVDCDMAVSGLRTQ